MPRDSLQGSGCDCSRHTAELGVLCQSQCSHASTWPQAVTAAACAWSFIRTVRKGMEGQLLGMAMLLWQTLASQLHIFCDILSDCPHLAGLEESVTRLKCDAVTS